ASGGLENLAAAASNTFNKTGAASGMIRKLAIAVTALSGPLMGVLALGPAAIFGGLALGVAAWKHSIDQAIQSNQKLTTTQQMVYPTLQKIMTAFAGLKSSMMAAFGTIVKAIDQVMPALQKVGQVLGPIIQLFAGTFAKIITTTFPLFADALQKSMPVLKALGDGLVQVMGGLAK